MDTRKDKITYKMSFYENFKEEKIPIIVCALSQAVDEPSIPLCRGVSIGIAIYNPKDTWDNALGEEIALRKAQENKTILYTTEDGVLNDDIIEAIIDSYIYKVRENPGKFIKGYDEAFNKYKKEQEKLAIINTLSPIELKELNYIKGLKEENRLDKYLSLI